MRMTALWWWIDRWRKSTAYTDMTLEEQGAYRNLLDEAHLRGGYLPNDERILAKVCGDVLAWKRVRRNVLKKFTKTEAGLQNETLVKIMQESARRSQKQADYRARQGNTSSNAHGNAQGNETRPPVPVPVLKISNSKDQANSKAVADTTSAKNTKSGNGGLRANSKRPIFIGQRFVVFEWMLEDINRILGPKQTDDFDIHTWFYELDGRIAQTDIVLQRNDTWPWLQTELVNEAARRGLTIAQPYQPRLGKQSQRLLAAIQNIAASERAAK